MPGEGHAVGGRAGSCRGRAPLLVDSSDASSPMDRAHRTRLLIQCSSCQRGYLCLLLLMHWPGLFAQYPHARTGCCCCHMYPPRRWRLVSAPSLPGLLMSTDPQASSRNGGAASSASDAGPRLLRSLVRGLWWFWGEGGGVGGRCGTRAGGGAAVDKLRCVWATASVLTMGYCVMKHNQANRVAHNWQRAGGSSHRLHAFLCQATGIATVKVLLPSVTSQSHMPLCHSHSPVYFPCLPMPPFTWSSLPLPPATLLVVCLRRWVLRWSWP